MLKVTTPAPENFPCLDGLRGVAAVWVLASHVQILSGTPYISVLSWGGLAVDLFMMLSGLLMAHHYVQRRAREPWEQASTWRTFWTRRFFRIAPLYYVCLVIALAMSPLMLEGRSAVASVWPETATTAARYAGFELGNVLAHITFVFGVLPDYAFRTPLPDWSIGLEMQFYLAFPFIMLLVSRFGLIRSGVLLTFVCLALRFTFPTYFKQFEMPAFLPIKLYAFMIGIWLAVGRANQRMTTSLVAALALAIAYAAYKRHAEAFGLIPLVLVLFYLLNDGTLPGTQLVEKIVSPVRAAFSGRVSRMLGDTSYGIYLVHLLVLIPVAGYFAKQAYYLQLPHAARFAICAGITFGVSLAIAWVGHKLVEQPGIKLGKKVASRMRSAPKLAPSV